MKAASTCQAWAAHAPHLPQLKRIKKRVNSSRPGEDEDDAESGETADLSSATSNIGLGQAITKFLGYQREEFAAFFDFSKKWLLQLVSFPSYG